MKGKIFILSGPSGSGKTTLYKNLFKRQRLKRKIVKILSVTTRSKRLGEKRGKDYIFVSHKMFLYKKNAGHFLESQKLFDNYYGTPNKNIREFLKKGKNILLCIDVKGADVICQRYTNVVKIFVKTVSMKILKKRLKSRRSENKKEIAVRLKIAKKELNEVKKYHYVVINDNLDKANEFLESIILKELGEQNITSK